MKDFHQQQRAVPFSRHLSHDPASTEHALLVDMNVEITSLRKENKEVLNENERLTTLYDEIQVYNDRLVSVQEDLFKQLEDQTQEKGRMQKQMQTKLEAVTNHSKETESKLQEKVKNQQNSISSLFNDLTASRGLVEELQKKLAEQHQEMIEISKRVMASDNPSSPQQNEPMSIEFSAGDIDFPDDMSDDGSVFSHGSVYSHYSTKSEMIPRGPAGVGVVGGLGGSERGLARQSSLRSVSSVDQADFLKGVVDSQSFRGRAGKMLFGSSTGPSSGASVCSEHSTAQMEKHVCTLEEENSKLRSALVKLQTQHKDELYKNQKTIQGLKQANEVILHKNRYINNTAPIKRRSASFTAGTTTGCRSNSSHSPPHSPSTDSDASSSPPTPLKSISSSTTNRASAPHLGRSDSLRRISDYKLKRTSRSSSFRRGLQEEDDDTFRPPTRGNRLTKLVEEENEGGETSATTAPPPLRRIASLQPTMLSSPPSTPTTPKTDNKASMKISTSTTEPEKEEEVCNAGASPSPPLTNSLKAKQPRRSKSLQPEDYKSLCQERREAAKRLLEHASYIGENNDDLASNRLSSNSSKKDAISTSGGGAIRTGLRRWWRKD